jgi:choline dehydrogenase-like flavoprotein
MGSDPATSVVDEYGRSHDVPNLVIVDGPGCDPTAFDGW